MLTIDWIVLTLFFLLMIAIGGWSYHKVKRTGDFFVAGGKLPWWLSGISHHVSGYSGVLFVAFAGIAYTHGITVYVWWAWTVGAGVIVGSFIIAPRWTRLRTQFNIQSPTEYLQNRYNLPTQQIIAWSGVLLKIFDVGAKWVSLAILLNVFTGIPLINGILLTSAVSIVYVTVGGLWAVVWTDFAQFIVQIIAGLVLFFAVLGALGGVDSVFTLWDQLPETHLQPFSQPYTAGFALAFLAIHFLSYNGGNWNLATRYISSSSGSDARKAALLSGMLYLFWPLIIFFPMWAGPVLLPNLEDPTQVYALLAIDLLPPGLVGLLLASLFASTMSMTSSDANTISAVITRDILPHLSQRLAKLKESLFMARTTTFVFTLLTVIIAIYADNFGGVVGLIIYWFGALVGPAAVPMILGLLPSFRHCNALAAISAIFAGIAAFAIVNFVMVDASETLKVASPVTTSFIVFCLLGLLNRSKPIPAHISTMMAELKLDAARKDPDGKQLN